MMLQVKMHGESDAEESDTSNVFSELSLQKLKKARFVKSPEDDVPLPCPFSLPTRIIERMLSSASTPNS